MIDTKVLLVGSGLCVALLTGRAVAAPAEIGDQHVFAEVPEPGHPETSITAKRRLYVGTTTTFDPDDSDFHKRSRIFVYDRVKGRLLNELVVQGEDLDRLHGVGGTAFDRDRRLYAAGGPGRATGGGAVYRFDVAVERKPLVQTIERETYARVPDLPRCEGGRPRARAGESVCSPTPTDLPPFPNDIEFDRAGFLYVTDSWQATIFRVPPGGGAAEVWFQDPRLAVPIPAPVPPPGPNGIRLSEDGAYLYVAVTVGSNSEARGGAIYRLPLADGQPDGPLELVHPFGQAGPDGLAFGRSGRLYVALGLADKVAILEPEGEGFEDPDLYPGKGVENLLVNPSSIEFENRRRSIYVTNHDVLRREPAPDASAVIEMVVRDLGIARPRPKIR